MVDHLLEISVEAGGARGAALAAALSAAGFTVRSRGGRAVAGSAAVEAAEAKARLRALGFLDREYRIRVEFTRRWGFL